MPKKIYTEKLMGQGSSTPATTGNIRTLLFYSSNSRCRTSNVIIPFWLSHRRVYVHGWAGELIEHHRSVQLFSVGSGSITHSTVCVCVAPAYRAAVAAAAYFSFGKIGELLSIIRTASSTPSIIFLSRLSFCCCCCCCCWGQYRNV
jgi:hypothetical protein